MTPVLGFTVLPKFARIAWPGQGDIKVIECQVQVVDIIWLIHRAEWPLSRRSKEAFARLREHVK